MSSVDVVVPCYNYARYLRGCVASVLTQADVDVRVLIIDDTSSDETPDVGAQLVAQDARVEYRRHSSNRGHIATYNEGLLEWASADYSLLLSADDLLAPGALSHVTSVMDRHEDAGLAYGMAVIISENTDIPTAAAIAQPHDRLLAREQFLERCYIDGNPVPTPAAVVRTRMQRELGGYRSDLPHSADMEMWMRFAVHGPVVVLRNVLAYYRWHRANMSSQYYGKALGDAQEQIQACREIASRWSDRVPFWREWLDAAARRLGNNAFRLAGGAYDDGNLTAFAECLAFAEDNYPNLRFEKRWWKLRTKEKLDWWLRWVARTSVAELRGQAHRPVSPTVNSPYRIGQHIGWWPTPD